MRIASCWNLLLHLWPRSRLQMIGQHACGRAQAYEREPLAANAGELAPQALVNARTGLEAASCRVRSTSRLPRAVKRGLPGNTPLSSGSVTVSLTHRSAGALAQTRHTAAERNSRLFHSRAASRRNFTELSTAGLDANCAAAYALKLTARTAARADVSALLASPAPGANFVERIVPNTSSRELPGDASMDADTEQELLLLFASADSLYLSLLLNLPAAQACTREVRSWPARCVCMQRPPAMPASSNTPFACRVTQDSRHKLSVVRTARRRRSTARRQPLTPRTPPPMHSASSTLPVVAPAAPACPW